MSTEIRKDPTKPTRIILKKPSSGESMNWKDPEGRAYWDPETDEPKIELTKPRIERGNVAHKMAKVLRHEIGHQKLHMNKYSHEESTLREKDLDVRMSDEIDVAIWEYSHDRNIKALRSRLKSLAQSYVRAAQIPTRQAEDKIAEIAIARLEELK